jgi:pimeloyl-ACP methyl ester carboxylesterase
VSGLVLCATSHRFRVTPPEHLMFASLPALEQASRVVPDVITRHIVSHLSAPYLSRSGYPDWAKNELLIRDPRAVLQAATALGRYSADHWIGDVDVPTSVVVHRRDHVVPPVRQTQLASAVRGATTHVVDADHFAVVREPQRFVRALVAAVDDVTHARALPVDLPRAS